MYAQLGTIIFQGLKGFESFTSRKEAVYAEHPLIEGKPRLQRNGSKLDTIDLTFSLHAKYTSVEGDISVLQTYVQDGEIVPFVLGNGIFVGEFVIVSIGEQVVQTDKNGNLISCDVDITLLEHVEPNKLGTRERNARDQAFARAQNLPSPAPIFVASQSLSGGLSNTLKATSVEATRVNTDLQSGIQNGAERQRKFASALASMRRMERDIADLNAKLARIQSIPQTVNAVQNEAERVLLAIEATKSYTEAQDIPSLISSNNDLQRAVRRMRVAGTKIDNATTTRRPLV
ncbi:MAG: phage tail protein [Flavobacteriales bacterium]|jgi:phage protein U